VSTGYGRALVAKLALVGLVVALGAYNHYRLVPAVVVEDDAVAWRLLGHTAAVEAMTIGVGILIATAAMTSGGL
jgi:putative copper export protein